jgi:hypothetical protein
MARQARRNTGANPFAHGDPASQAAVRQRAQLLCLEKMEPALQCVVATAMTTDAAGGPAPPAGAGQAGRARKLGGWLAR